jgi:hypothetical protein
VFPILWENDLKGTLQKTYFPYNEIQALILLKKNFDLKYIPVEKTF